jgi:hypothetical protein
MHFSLSKSQFVCRSFGSHFLTSQNDIVYKFIYAGSLRWQSDHFRKLCSVRRSFIGAMTFNFDHMAYRIFFHCTSEAYFTINTNWFWRKSIIFFWRYVDKNSYLNVRILVNERDSLFLIHYKNSNSISSRCIFWCVFVAIIWFISCFSKKQWIVNSLYLYRTC